MRRLTLITMVALAFGLFQACKSNKSGSSADSTAAGGDTSKMASSATKKDSSATTAKGDTTFADKAAMGGMTEVALGKLALTKTSSAKIKKFANMMVMDHGKANDELMGIAKTKNIPLPVAVDVEHQQKIDSLGKLSSKDFDKAYVDAMIDGHKKTLDLMNDEAKNGKDADFKAFAAKTAPVVQKHLDAINNIHKSIK